LCIHMMLYQHRMDVCDSYHGWNEIA
jgi:hypothetical protein